MNPLSSLTAFAEAWWTCVLHSTWQSSLVVLAAFAIVWLRRRRSATFLYAVLVVALLKFLMPPIISLPVLEGPSATPMIARAPEATPVAHSVPAVSVDAPASELVLAAAPPAATSPAPQPMAATPPDAPAPAATLPPPVALPTQSSSEAHVTVSEQSVRAFNMLDHWKLLLAMLHGIGALVLGFLMAGSYLHLRRLLRAAHPAALELSNLANEVAKRLGLRCRVSVLLTAAPCAPMAAGLFKRRILLPEVLAGLRPDELRAILAHELAHHRRLDLAVVWMEHLVTLLWWFNPLVWMLIRALHRTREDCCDDMVLSLGLAGDSEYCDTLLRAAKRLHRPLAPRLIFGCASKLHPMAQRLTRIMDTAIRRRAALTAWGTAGVIVMGLVLLPTFLPVAADANDARTGTDEARTSTDAAQTAEAGATAEAAGTSSSDPVSKIEKEISAHYANADAEIQDYIRWTAKNFTRGNLWYAHNAFAQLAPEDREKKIAQIVEALNAEYGRHLCPALAEAGAIKDARLLPGLIKAASYHRDDSDYDCRPKWMAVSALGRQDDISAVPTLIPLVDHGNTNTRMWARASLVRLTGQNFKDDKQAWGTWWNNSGHEPKIDLSQLKPWVMPGQAQAATPPPAAPPSRPLQPAVVPPESQAVVDALPGELVFKGSYFHRSRGSDLSAPSVVWIKKTSEGEVIAASYLPAFNDTSVAYLSPNTGFRRYEGHYQGRDGGAPSARYMDLADGAVTVAYEGGEKNGTSETLTVPPKAIFMPNSRPDSYTAHMGIAAFQGTLGLPAEPGELLCYDWDNTGKGMASYTIRMDNKGKEEVTVPAGTFSATHYVENHLTFGDTWYKKRPGHITDYWVLDNGVIVRILRHREPYELQLQGVETPAELPGFLGKAEVKAAGTLKVLSAVYGAGDRWIDLTEVLNQRIENDTLEVQVTNELGGDPIYGSPKQLNVHFRVGDKTFVITVDELETLRLPEPPKQQSSSTGIATQSSQGGAAAATAQASASAKRPLTPVSKSDDTVVFKREEMAQELASWNYADVVTTLNPQMAKDKTGAVVGITSDNFTNVPLFGAIGLQNGDVVNTINGIMIDSDQRLAEILEIYSDSSDFRLGVTRNGEPVTLSFRLE